jgi:hypothetical protein
MALPATDNFTTGPSQNLDSRTNWTLNSGGAGCLYIQNTADAVHSVAVDENIVHWDADTFANDQYSQCSTITGRAGATSLIGVAVRCHATAATGYYFYLSGTNSYLNKLVGGSYTQLGSTGDGGTNELMRIEAEGTTITPMCGSTPTEWASIGAQTDSSITSGYAGVSGYAEDTAHKMDDWEGGDLGAGPAARRIFVTHC